MVDSTLHNSSVKYLSDIHFSIHSILVDETLKHRFYEWARGGDLGDYIPRTLDWVYSPINKSDIPDSIDWGDVIDYIERLPLNKKYGTVTLEAEQKKIDRMETAEMLFDRFLHEGLGFGEEVELEEKWNKTFNSVIEVDYDSFTFDIRGMSSVKDGKPFELYDQQIKGIAYLCRKGNGLLAYDVGVGKTACGICAAVYQMQHGRCKCPLIIVPNAVYTKWIHDIHELFPKITVNELHNLNKEIISNLNIKDGTVSICTTEALGNITLTRESVESWVKEDFKYLINIKKQEELFLPGDDLFSKETVNLEEMGFDLLVVDEAHRYKNLVRKTASTGVYSEFSNLGFGEPSVRALKMYALTQYVHRNNNNQNVFFLTATPFSNSPMEIYSMLLYVGGNKLSQMGYKTINDFLDEFAEVSIEWAVDNKGEVKQKTIMKKFRSLFALQNLIRDVIDKVSAEEAEINRPEKISHVEKVYMTDLQRKIYDAEVKRIESSNNLGATFIAMNNMRMAMLSPCLVKSDDYDFAIPAINYLVEESPKLTLVCNSIVKTFKEKPDCGQIIYMPRGVKESQELKNYLIRNGIPANAIGLINSSVNDVKKDKMTDDFNNPEKPLKIIIGSETISEGIDLNGNSISLYNCMLGWNPSEPVQVEGRLWRQGNRQKKVHIIYPIMFNSIDSLIYQKHDEKGTRIDAIWSYRGDKLNVEDIKPEDLKLELIKDPEKKADYLIAQECLPVKRNIQILNNKLELVELAKKKAQELIDNGNSLKRNIAELGKDPVKNALMIQTLNNNLNRRRKDYVRMRENYQKMLDNLLPKSDVEREKIVDELNRQKLEQESILQSIMQKKYELILKLREKQKVEQSESESLEETIERLSREILMNLESAITR